ncbi:MAG: two-component system sensor histidine kinase RegB [Kiritimatiellia bacterium]|jgi:two-component system sensor histidine kinase RegB
MTGSPHNWADPGVDEGTLWLRWLVRLRWLALLAQVVTLSFTFSVLQTPYLILPLMVVMAVLAFGNIEAARRLRQDSVISQRRLAIHLATEVIALTIFLLCAGGSNNPFVVLYLIHVCMGAVMLTWGKAVSVTTLVVGCYAILTVIHFPIYLDQHTLPVRVLLYMGNATAFVITAASATGFTIGVVRTLRGHRTALLEARDRTAKIDRLRTNGTLAAGAAHELNTPLTTIGLRLRRITRRYIDPDTVGDVSAIRGQLDRCKEIVDQLLMGAGDPSASGIERRQLGVLVRLTTQLWSKGSSLDVKIYDNSSGAEIEVPPVPFRQALINLLENAREAQESTDETRALEVWLDVAAGRAQVRVRDHGCGLPEQVGQVGDPFFTTKGTGTGLGVYVARAVADGAGGGLRYKEQKGTWTEAVWWFPIAMGDPAGGSGDGKATSPT